MIWGSLLPNILRCVFTHVSYLFIVYSDSNQGHQDISTWDYYAIFFKRIIGLSVNRLPKKLMVNHHFPHEAKIFRVHFSDTPMFN